MGLHVLDVREHDFFYFFLVSISKIYIHTYIHTYIYIYSKIRINSSLL
jgi:hypothetical protein